MFFSKGNLNISFFLLFWQESLQNIGFGFSCVLPLNSKINYLHSPKCKVNLINLHKAEKLNNQTFSMKGYIYCQRCNTLRIFQHLQVLKFCKACENQYWKSKELMCCNLIRETTNITSGTKYRPLNVFFLSVHLLLREK